MNAQLVMYVVSGLVLASWLCFSLRRRWNLPAAHGPGFFMGFEVGPDFSGPPARQWMARYHASLIVELAVILAVGAWLVAADLWRWLPGWAGGMAVLFTLNTGLFRSWLRRSLPAIGESAPARVALSLETRRVTDYLSITSETLLAVVLVSSWWWLLTHGSAGWRWQSIAVWTYLAVVGTIWKVQAIRGGVPLPADRPLEHQKWLDSHRRYAVRVLDCLSWLCVLIVAGYAARHTPLGERAAGVVRSAVFVLVLVAWLTMVWVIAREGRRLAAEGGALRPVQAWRGLSRQRPWNAAGGAWGVGFVAGLVILIAMGLLS